MSWKDPKKWEAIRSGEDCPMCADLSLEENDHSFFVAELGQSYVRLPKNQFVPGWVIVAYKKHFNEIFEPSDEESMMFALELKKVAKAVEEIFHPVKINIGSYGNLCPHLHFHIFPRHINDDPHAPVKPDEGERFLQEEDYQKIIQNLRKALENLAC